jgi:hypothetical protein
VRERSLEHHFQGEFELVMLCMDDLAVEICEKLNLLNTRVISIKEIEQRDKDLAHVKPARTMGEYCWTCTPVLLLYLLDSVAPGEIAVYLDADLMFFSSPQPVFHEWADADIAIHEHRFPPHRRHMESSSGIFNVGWVGIRNSCEGRECLARWRAQCIEACTTDAERGLWGDQKYLDEWPILYNHLTILQHPGVGLGPWNVEGYELVSLNETPHVSGAPLIFYHFHGLRIVHESFLGHIAIVPSAGYRFSAHQKRLLYARYAAALRAAEREVARLPAGVELPRNRLSLSALAHMMLRADILFARSAGRSYPLGSIMTALDLLKSARRHFIRLSGAAPPAT